MGASTQNQMELGTVWQNPTKRWIYLFYLLVA